MTDYVKYSMFREYIDRPDGGTVTYGIRYNIPGEEHILCSHMYEWEAIWLVDLLNEITCELAPEQQYPHAPRKDERQ